MRFYNIKMAGKFIIENRDTPAFSADDTGRILYDDVQDQFMFQDSTAWNKVWTEANVDELMTALESLTGSLGGWERIGTTLTPKEEGDTVQALTIDTTNFSTTNADINEASIDNLSIQKEVYGSQFSDGSSGSSKTIDWTEGARHSILLTANCTLTFVAPSGPTNLLLLIQQDATGSRTITWPAGIRWVGGIVPTLSTTANYIDIVGLYYSGSFYYATLSKHFS